MNGLNGIIVDGNVYEAIEWNEINPCENCDLWEQCSECSYNVEPICSEFIDDSIFRFSQSLTDKINEK